MSRAVFTRRALERGYVQRNAHDAPQCARSTLLTVGVQDVQLQHLAARWNDRAVAIREYLLAVMAQNAQVDHVPNRLRGWRRWRGREWRALRGAGHRRLSLSSVESCDQ